MAQVIWTIKAVEQIEEIGLFIEKDSPFQSRRVVQLIIKETTKLKSHIRIGHIIPEMQDDKYRELRVFSYRILYKLLSEDRVAIIGVVYGYRLFNSQWIE